MVNTAAEPTWSLADWTVLGLLIEQPRHGFSLVKELGPDTLLGHVWSVPNPMIYRALRGLQAKGLIVPARAENSTLGPRRVPMRPTAKGRRCFDDWLQLPVEHFRDARVLLRVKLHLTIRLGLDPMPLLLAQQAVFDALGSRMAAARWPGSEAERNLLQLWREESSAAAQAFISHALELFDPKGVTRSIPRTMATTTSPRKTATQRGTVKRLQN